MGARFRPRQLRLAVTVILATTFFSGVAYASLSQGFPTKDPITSGSLVSLAANGTSVEAASLANVSRLFGVAVPDSAAPISLGGSNATGQVQVVTSGSADVLVSTEGGTIHVGDYVTVSSISGVGQKVPDGSHRVIGTAQADFDGSGSDTAKRTITDSSGAKHEVTIGQIPVVIAISTYTSNTGNQGYQLPIWLQNFSNQLAGRSVTPVRIILASIILVVTLVSITVLLYSAVRNSIISIGRNPLSRSSVLRGLLEVIGIVIVLMVVAAGAMYLVITR
jgi:hypothetical protein